MLKYLFPFLILLIPLDASAYSLITKVADGHMVRIFHIPRNDVYRVKAVASNTGTTLQALVKKGRGVAGINAAYFLSGYNTGKPDRTNAVRIVDRIGFIYSRFYPDTGISGLFGFLSDNSPILIQNNMYGPKELKENFNVRLLWGIESGIANFPILLVSGISYIFRYNELGLITDNMKKVRTNSFICRTENGDVKMGTIENISMLDVPDFIIRFGCKDAINLDSGKSLAMYDNRKYIVGPGQNIMDAFIIVRK